MFIRNQIIIKINLSTLNFIDFFIKILFFAV